MIIVVLEHNDQCVEHVIDMFFAAIHNKHLVQV